MRNLTIIMMQWYGKVSWFILFHLFHWCLPDVFWNRRQQDPSHCPGSSSPQLCNQQRFNGGGNDTILVRETGVVNIEDIPAVILQFSTSWQSHLEVKYNSPESPPNVISSCDQDRNIQIKPNLPSVASFISCQKSYTLHSISTTVNNF